MKVILRSTLHLILCLVLYVSAHGQLQSLSTYGGLTPAFSPDVYNYSRVIGPRTGTITLNFTVAAGTTVKINGVNVSTLYYTVNANGTPCTLEVTAANGVKSVYTIQMPMLSLTLNITNATCGKNDGAVSAIFNNATEPYTIRWYDANYNAKGIGTSTSGLAPGGYWCNAVLSDGSGSFVSTYFTVGVNNTLAINGVKTDVTCAGAATGQVALSPSGGTAPYTYLWSNGTTDATAGNLASGVYSVTVNDAAGCTRTGSFTITQPNALSATTTSTGVTCNGAKDGKASVSPAGGTAPYTYTWTNANSTSSSVSTLGAGTYSCTIKDKNGCTLKKDFTINEPTAITASAVQADVTCYGLSNGSVALTPTGGTPGATGYTYVWAPAGGTLATAKNLAAGNYSCEIKDSRGCKINQSFAVAQPVAALTATTTSTVVSCHGGGDGTATINANGGTAPYTYLWTGKGITGKTATGLSATTHSYNVTDDKGCTFTGNVAITQPAAALATVILQAQTSCAGLSRNKASVTASGGTAPYSYKWLPLGGNNTVTTELPAGDYAVTITDSKGCTLNKAITLVENPLPTVSPITGKATVLVNGSTTLDNNVTGGRWSSSNTGVAIVSTFGGLVTGVAPGTAIITYTVSNGVCENKTTHQIQVNPLPPQTSIAGGPASFTNQQSASFYFSSNVSSVTYQASVDSSVFITVPNPFTISGLTAGNHTLSVRAVDSYGTTGPVQGVYKWTVDIAPPTGSIVINANAVYTNKTTVTLAVTAGDDNGAVEAAFSNDGKAYSEYAAVSPEKTWELNSGDGNKTVYVQLRDKAGNTSVTTASIWLDRTAPAVPVITQPAHNSSINNTLPVVKGTAEADAAVAVYVDGTFAATVHSNAGENWQYPTIHPLRNGAHEIKVKATDKAGNESAFTNITRFIIDTTALTAQLSSQALQYVNAAFKVSIVFNKPVTDFDKNDLVVVNGVVSDFTSIDGSTYNATITPAADGEVIVSVTENAASDAAGNGNIASDTLVRKYDATRPTVTIATAAKNPLNKAFDITVTFSEAVTGFGKSGLTVENGAISSFTSIDATTYTATITPAVNGEVKVSVAENSASDAAGNGNVASDTLLRNYDATRPTVTVTTSAANPLNKAFDIAVTFSEAVTGFGKSGLTVENGAISSFTSIDATTYTATITPAVNGEVKVSVAENSASDAAGNGNIASDTLLRNYDATRPTVTVTTSAANPLNKAFDIAVAFSEAVTGFGKSDLVLENGAISSFTSIDATTYTATITPAVDGEVKVSVAENSASDAAGNGNIASDTLVRKYDATKPVATITTTATNPLNKAFDITVTFSEAVTGFGKSGFAVENGAVSGFTVINATTYTATITPAVNGEVKVSVAENSASDAAGNGNIASDTLVRKYDAARPTVTITTTAANRLNKSFDITVTFSEVVTGFGNSGLAVYNGAISGFTSIDATTYTATITPAVDGEVKVSVAENSASDAAGNGNIASDTLAHKYDATKPVATITSIATNPLNKAFDITVAFSEAVTGFGKSGFAVENGAVSGFTVINATTYTATITPAVDGEVKVSVAENSASDAAGNGNIASDTLVRKYDAARPTVTITTTAANPLNKAFDIAVTFSEAVTGFGKSGLTVENGAISIFTSIDATTYTATITPAVDGEVKVSVAEKSALDAAGNGNIASDALVRKYDATKPVATITSIATNPLNKAFDITVTFSEAVTGFGKSGFAVENGAVSGFTVINATTCTATITPAVDGEVKVSVAENSASDAAGNGNIASDTLVRKYDAARPTVIITTTAPNPLNKSFDITVTFSEVVTGFGNSGLAVYNGAISSFTSIDATTYTATITPAGDGEVKVSVAENSASDAAGNGNIASDTLLRNYDATRPTVTVTTSAANPLNGVFDVVVKFSEAVIGFNKAGLVVANGAVSGFMRVDATTYTATIVPAMDGEVKVSVAENSASDAAGNGNVASDTLVRKYDAARSTVTITTTAANPLNKA
ncbi:Ig-like domain-containing protein, partial [Filimonas zeae]|uniref:Ig-like domain-containing protein n=1 Tax=Filimonas zeae TaxID=1737353 RepID=UPI0016657D83